MAPLLNPPAIITLRIKVPPGSVAGNGHDVFDLGEVPTAATVGRLRLNIERALPSRPAPANQRLLYAGRALVDNDQTIAEALNTRRDPTQIEYVVHLLVKGEGNQPAHVGTGSSQADVSRTATPNAAVLPTAVPPSGLATTNSQPHNHHHHHHTHHLAHAQAHAQALAQHQARQMTQQQAILEASRQNAGSISPQNSLFNSAPGFPASDNFPGLTNQPGVAHLQRGNTGSPQPPSLASVPPPSTEPDVAHPAPQISTQASASQPLPQGLPQAHQHAALRPVDRQGFHLQGINHQGQHFQIHQQTLNFPGNVDPQRLASLMGRPAAPGAGVPSALDRARENMFEMQRMLNEMRGEATATEEQRNQIASLQERARNVHSYIDPLGLGTAPGGHNGRSSAPPGAHTQTMPPQNSFSNVNGLPNSNHLLPRFAPPDLTTSTRLAPQPAQSADVTCYLLSSPQGPQALLFSPEHGRYTGRFHSQTPEFAATPTPTQVQQPPTPAANNAQQALQLARPDHAADGVANPPPDAVAAAVAQQAQARAAENANPLQAVLGHFWLLLRVLIFAYFLLGSNMGWKRPMALALIGLGFWLVRMGLFGDGGVARRWWEGIIAVRPVPGANRNEAADNDNQARPAGGAFPTPAQVAQRLLDARDQQDRDRLQRIREFVRPVERVVALFVASLWPGVGEERVRLQEAEERRVREEEVERNRLAVEAREAESQRKAEVDAEKEKDNAKTGESSVVETAQENAGVQGTVVADENQVESAAEGPKA